MAITTLDGALAGMRPPEDLLKVGATMEAAGVLYSPFYVGGRPAAAAAPSPGLNGAALTTYAGQIPFTNPGAGNSYLARFEGAATLGGRLLLCDRLWHNSGYTVTTTTAQNTTHPGLPARDANGATNGEGVMLGIEVSTATTNGSAITNMTASYTDQGGTAGATATVPSFPATATVGTFVPFNLAAGDTGVRSVQSLTLGTSLVTGVVHLVQYRVLASLNCPVANVGACVDALTGGFVRLYDNTVPFLLWVPSATTAVTLLGQMIVTQG